MQQKRQRLALGHLRSPFYALTRMITLPSDIGVPVHGVGEAGSVHG
jgi:hypothetical protein